MRHQDPHEITPVTYERRCLWIIGAVIDLRKSWHQEWTGGPRPFFYRFSACTHALPI